MSSPVLSAPDFSAQFKLTVHASDAGIDADLFQQHNDYVDRVGSYFSKKPTKCQQNYSTIAKECLTVLLALQHFDVYLNVTVHPILVLWITIHSQFCIKCQERIKDSHDGVYH
jgi:hypothetical protein